MFHKFISVADSKSVIVTAAGKKEIESGKRKGLKYIGECTEQGVLLSSITAPVITPDVKIETGHAKADAEKTVEEILNSPMQKSDELVQEMAAKADAEKITMATVPNPPSDDAPINYGHQ